MKKILTAFLCVVMIVSVTACGGIGGKKSQCRPGLNTAFSVTAVITYDDKEYNAAVMRYSVGNWDVTFSSPNTLSGVLLAFRGDQVDASYKGLSFSVPKTALPLKSMIINLIDAVDSAAGEDSIECSEDGELMLIDGENEHGKYVLKLNKNGELAGFSMPNLNMEMTFTDFAPGQSEPPASSEAPTEAATETETTVVSDSESVETSDKTDPE